MKRPKAICKHAGCGRLIDSPGVCEAHKKDLTGWYQTSVERADARGYGAPWAYLRKLILARDCGLCQPCKRSGRLTVATQVDHIVPKSQGGSDDASNLQSICDDCHSTKTLSERNL